MTPTPIILRREPREGDHFIEELDGSGHTTHAWDPNNEAEVAAANALYDTLKGKKYLAFKTNPDGTKGELIDAFDPAAGRMTMTPPMAGG